MAEWTGRMVEKKDDDETRNASRRDAIRDWGLATR